MGLFYVILSPVINNEAAQELPSNIRFFFCLRWLEQKQI